MGTYYHFSSKPAPQSNDFASAFLQRDMARRAGRAQGLLPSPAVGRQVLGLHMDDVLFELFGIERHHLGEALTAALILVLGLALAWVASRLLPRVVPVLSRSREAALNGAIVREVRFPVVAMVVVQSLFSAVLSLSHVDPVREVLERVWAPASLCRRSR